MQTHGTNRHHRSAARATPGATGPRACLLGSALLAIAGCQPDPASTTQEFASSDRPVRRLRADALEWRPVALTAFPEGIRIAALEGDSNGPGAYTLRARFPDGYLFPSHRHAADQQITVIVGTFLLAEGDRFDFVRLRAHGPGDVLIIPAGRAHYGGVEGETVVQFHGTGPFEPLLVDPYLPEAALGGER